MRRFSEVGSLVAVAVVGLLASSVASAGSIPSVSYTVSGSSGDWTLDFTVQNDTNQGLYFWGVVLPAFNITGSPLGWNFGGSSTWTNAPYGGSANVYNNVWLTQTGGDSIAPGGSIGDFDALVTTATAPTSVAWFAITCDATGFPSDAYCLGGPYTGGLNTPWTNTYSNDDTPLFESTAGVASGVPEPGSLPLFATALAAVALLVGRKRVGQALRAQ